MSAHPSTFVFSDLVKFWTAFRGMSFQFSWNENFGFKLLSRTFDVGWVDVAETIGGRGGGKVTLSFLDAVNTSIYFMLLDINRNLKTHLIISRFTVD